MVLSRERFDYHLTDRGWVEGTEQLDFGAGEEKPIPKNRVLTVCVHEEIPSIGAKEQRWCTVVWRDKDRSRLKKLLRKFGRHPPHPPDMKVKISWK